MDSDTPSTGKGPAANLAARRQRIILGGDVPSPTAVPSGCGFRTRCPLAQKKCHDSRPLLRPVADGQSAACHFATPNPIPTPQEPAP